MKHFPNFKTACLILTLSACDILAAETVEPYNSGNHTTRPMPAPQAAAEWKLPPGFSATVFAAEPDVRQPIAMTFDDRGRLWVAECYTYAEVKKGFDDQLRDRIVIFEDKDGDGRFDQRTVFSDDLQHLSSIEVGFGGVWALTSPNLVFIPDRNGDDRPDGPPEVQLDGFEWQRNHHTIANGLRWGPDGWLYGRHGIQAVSSMGTPGTPAEKRVQTNGGIWRYHPQRHTVEVVCHGTTNPWGIDWNEFGEGFFINTVIGHLWHMIPGAHFRRMHGNDLNPHAYEVIDQHADHVHWATGEAWNDWRKIGTTDATSAAGGGHAHTGLMFYAGDNWPDSWRGKLLTINFNGRRLNVENVVRTPGSGYVGQHQPDIGFSADPWFRGIDLIYGPDGGVFIADWSDSGECHDDDGVFRQSGRIYKITHGKPTPPAITDVAALKPAAWVELLGAKNEFFARHARRRIQEWAASPLTQASQLQELREQLKTQYHRGSSTVLQLRTLWSLHAAGGADTPFLLDQLRSPNEHIQSWAIRLLTDDRENVAKNPSIAQALADYAGTDPSPFVNLALASALQRIPVAQRIPLARNLTVLARDREDHNLPLMLWYGVEALAETHPEELASIALASNQPVLRRSVSRRYTLLQSSHSDPINILLREALPIPHTHADILEGMWLALQGQRNVQPPSGWKMASRVFADNENDRAREHYRSLGLMFGDPFAVGQVRAVALNESAVPAVRKNALRSLIQAKIPNLRAVCETLLTVPGLSATAADGLLLEQDNAVAEFILSKLNSVEASERDAVVSAAVSRPTWARTALEAVASQKIPRSTLTTYHARQIRRHKDPQLTQRLEEVWGTVRDSDADKQSKMAQWKSRLTSESLKGADLAHGKALFGRVCASCHILNGEGGKIGPELTGSARDNLDYLLLNILDPSAAVAREYQLVSLNMKDGRSLTGFIRSRNDKVVVLQTLAEQVSLPLSDVESTDASTLSLMPEGLLDALKEDEVRDLVAYLSRK